MGETTIWDTIRNHVAHLAWRVFLWAGPLTEQQFREEIYLDVLAERMGVPVGEQKQEEGV